MDQINADQINADLVSRRDFFKKSIKNRTVQTCLTGSVPLCVMLTLRITSDQLKPDPAFKRLLTSEFT